MMNNAPKMKQIKLHDVLSIMFSAYGAGQSLTCRVTQVSQAKDNTREITLTIMPENADSASVWVGDESIYAIAMQRHKDGVFTVNSKQWRGIQDRLCAHYSDTSYRANVMADQGQIVEAALSLDSKEAAVEFLTPYLAKQHAD